MKLSASFIASLANTVPAQTVADAVAGGITFNSQRLQAGEAFFALAGERQHGIAFADEALAKGAAFIVSDKAHPQGILVEKPEALLLELGSWARRELACPVIGITGSAGKTSCKTFVAAALQAKASPGNLNTPLALACILVKHLLESPQSILVLELGIDHKGEMAELVRLVQPSHAIITSIGPSHLLGLGSTAEVAREKASILSLGAKALLSTQAAQFIKTYPYETYGFDKASYSASLGTDERSLSYKGITVHLPSHTAIMAHNAVAAMAMAEIFGLDLAVAAAALEEARLEPGRLEFKQLGQVLLINDSYNSNPLSVAEALAVLKKQAAPHAAILGDMLELGSHSHSYHHELGEATRGIRTFAIGREAIAILEANPKAQHYLTVESFLAQLPRFDKGTVLVKASRGMRLERVVAALMGAMS